jgi:hypothetical protein
MGRAARNGNFVAVSNLAAATAGDICAAAYCWQAAWSASNLSDVLFGPGATGIVGAAGGATHAAKACGDCSYTGKCLKDLDHTVTRDILSGDTISIAQLLPCGLASGLTQPSESG